MNDFYGSVDPFTVSRNLDGPESRGYTRPGVVVKRDSLLLCINGKEEVQVPSGGSGRAGPFSSEQKDTKDKGLSQGHLIGRLLSRGHPSSFQTGTEPV